jgi:hypothetical protein
MIPAAKIAVVRQAESRGLSISQYIEKLILTADTPSMRPSGLPAQLADQQEEARR